MYPHRLPWVAPHTQQLQCWPNVGTTIPDLDTLELVVLMLLMLAILVYGCFNVGTTIPDSDTLELVVLMLLMWYKVVLQPYTNPPTTICPCNVFFFK